MYKQLANPVSSPGDPLFYLHHTWLDKVWWDWQAIDPKSRLYDIGGTNEQDPCRVLSTESFRSSPPPPKAKLPYPPWGNWTFSKLPNGNTAFPGLPDGIPESDGCVNGVNTWIPYPFPKVPGDPGKVTTLKHSLSMLNILPNITVRDVMDTDEFLCYEYV